MNGAPGSQAPARSGPLAAIEHAVRRALIGLVKAYRLLLSPVLGASCRFTPTCSVYALQALERHGAGRGTCLTLARLARCHPWCQGGVDEVPGAADRAAAPDEGRRGAGRNERLFSRLLSSSSQKKNS